MKPKIWGVKPKTPARLPLIEITGYPDTGKRLIADLVAKKLKGVALNFPVFDVTSFTGRALIVAIRRQPEKLIENPHWWAHLYAANLYEKIKEIDQYRADLPLIVTNYVTAFKIWARAAIGKPDLNLKSFTLDLPEPNLVYSVLGDPWETPGNVPFNLSTELLLHIRAGMRTVGDKRVKIAVSKDELKYRHTQINDVASLIANDVSKKYSLPINDSYEFTKEMLPLKGRKQNKD